MGLSSSTGERRGSGGQQRRPLAGDAGARLHGVGCVRRAREPQQRPCGARAAPEPRLALPTSVAPSASWTRVHGDVSATRQKWCCDVHGARYRTTIGVLVELLHNNKVYGFLAAFPDVHIAKAMAVQGAARERRRLCSSAGPSSA